MHGEAGNARVLVVDDEDDIRTAISRTLTASGYHVDAASSLAEAKALDPAGYDVLLVDVRLGADRGIELVEMLRSREPAAATQCLVITGGTVADVPADVAVLTKPFQPSELVEAVRRLSHSAASLAPEGQMASAPGPAPGAAAHDRLAAGRPAPWHVLDIARQLRVRQRRDLADLLHDGPIQELTAAAFELEGIRRAMEAAPVKGLDELAQRVDEAGGSLHCLLDGLWSLPGTESCVAAALERRTAWLLATPLTVDVSEGAVALLATEILVVADIAEMILFGTGSAEVPTRAHAAVRADEDVIFLELQLSPVAHSGSQPDPATARAALDSLAAVMRARAHADLHGRSLRIWMELRRAPGTSPSPLTRRRRHAPPPRPSMTLSTLVSGAATSRRAHPQYCPRFPYTPFHFETAIMRIFHAAVVTKIRHSPDETRPQGRGVSL